MQIAGGVSITTMRSAPRGLLGADFASHETPNPLDVYFARYI